MGVTSSGDRRGDRVSSSWSGRMASLTGRLLSSSGGWPSLPRCPLEERAGIPLLPSRRRSGGTRSRLRGCSAEGAAMVAGAMDSPCVHCRATPSGRATGGAPQGDQLGGARLGAGCMGSPAMAQARLLVCAHRRAGCLTPKAKDGALGYRYPRAPRRRTGLRVIRCHPSSSMPRPPASRLSRGCPGADTPHGAQARLWVPPRRQRLGSLSTCSGGTSCSHPPEGRAAPALHRGGSHAANSALIRQQRHGRTRAARGSQARGGASWCSTHCSPHVP